MQDKKYLWIVIILGIALIVLTLLPFELKGPDSGLTEWTSWAAKYVALAIAAQKIWKVSDVMINRLKRN